MRASKPDGTPVDRETSDFDEMLRRSVQEALDDPRPMIPAEKVFADLRAHHAKRLKAAGREA